MPMTPEQLGHVVRKTRRDLGVLQTDLALTAGTGVRFISDLENGKPTCQIGKTLRVLQSLGIQSELKIPLQPESG